MDTRNKASSDTKLVARHAISTFGAPPSVWRFTCEREDFSLDIGGCADRPVAGVVSYTTIGLSDFDVVTGAEPPAHVELAAACTADRPLFPNILAAAAMLLMRRQKDSQAGRCHSRRGCRVLSPRRRIASLSDPPVSVGRAAPDAARRGEEHHLAAGRPGHQRRTALPGDARRRGAGATLSAAADRHVQPGAGDVGWT